MTKYFDYRGVALFAALWATCIVAICSVTAGAQPVSTDEGLLVFKSANCVGCHKWSGTGGGGYGGAAANLRQTNLSLNEIEQTIRCGRPATGMPHFEAGAYTDGRCYGLKAADLTDGKMPPEPDHPLRPSEIHTVATYVMTHIKDQGEPDFAQCQAFFGTNTRVCDTYGKQDGAQTTTASSSSGSGSSPAHMKVDAAADANVTSKTVGK